MLLLAAGQAGPALASEPAPALPTEVQRTIREQYASPELQLRYLSGAADLNGDGQAELLVHLVGPGACGTGGCPTLVFERRDSAYRLVSSIGLTRPPIRVGAESAAGWRNLIVHVSGGGAKAADVELRFDGRAYPQNPSTLPAAQAERMQAATVVIAEFRSFEQAHPLPRVAPGPPPEPATAAAPAGPSFDCGQARSAAEKLVCSDPELARLDRDLATIYAAGMAQWPVEHHAVARTWQRRWIAEREACAEGAEPRACVEQSYRRRLVELRIQTGAYEVPAAVGYLCKQREQTPFTAVFYQQAEPRAAVLTYGDRQEVVFAVPSASGARYANARVEFWEHQGEAAVRWEGESLSCAVIPRQR